MKNHEEDEIHSMHSESDIIETMMNHEADEVIKQLSESLNDRYQDNVESLKGSEYDYVYFSY